MGDRDCQERIIAVSLHLTLAGTPLLVMSGDSVLLSLLSLPFTALLIGIISEEIKLINWRDF